MDWSMTASLARAESSLSSSGLDCPLDAGLTAPGLFSAVHGPARRRKLSNRNKKRMIRIPADLKFKRLVVIGSPWDLKFVNSESFSP
jgi:hypothetical protein